MSPKKHVPDTRTANLFDVAELTVRHNSPVPPGPDPALPCVKHPRNPVWSDNKAKLIALYLKFFVYVTRHGAYLDAFAGPQSQKDDEGSWSARLVMESEPRWLQKFFLFDDDTEQRRRLQDLVARQPRRRLNEPKRRARTYLGNVNETLPKMLAERPIKDKEATFALLDQRTFECEWRTVEALARYKPKGEHKIELFYFLANSWLDRALAALKDEEKCRAWWGRDDFGELRALGRTERVERLCRRFRNELGYASVDAWPIYEKEHNEGVVMYYMIHATDHPAAYGLMSRAYTHVTERKPPPMQLSLDEFLRAMPEAEEAPASAE